MTRRTAAAAGDTPAACLGESRSIEPGGGTTTRSISLLRPSGRPIEIGELYHRAEDSGFPHPYEVWVHGAGTFDFYPTFEDAEQGARDFAAAASRIARGKDHCSLRDIPRPYALAHPVCPTCGHHLPAPTPEAP